MDTRHPPFALFDNATSANGVALLFTDPVEVIEANQPDDVPAALARLDAVRDAGGLVAGYLAYELGYCLEPKLRHLLPAGHGPLLRFTVFRTQERLTARRKARWLLERTTKPGDRIGEAPAFDLETYRPKFDRVRNLIASGDVYQVNLTMRLRLQAPADVFETYRVLSERARAGACSFLHFDDEDVLSLSPEQFFTVSRGRLAVRPMKGTVARRPDPVSDRKQIQDLQADEKQRAENLMIVDLMRNDISRVCKPGSVRVDDLFTVETYPTFHTLTSGISGELAAPARFATLLPALFPCGSVTGAPKIRAMEIIREVEDGPRGVYCGAIGFATPDAMAFNVAIRTISVRGGDAQMGVGGGIVWDSEVRQELDECRLKARFFTDAAEPFRLIETLRWSAADGFRLLPRHLARLSRSAAYFGFPFNADEILRHLDQVLSGQTGLRRVRLTLGVRGDTQVETADLTLPQPGETWRYALAPSAVSSGDWRLYHKTTRREVYEERLAAAIASTPVDEIILFNERGELTEGSRSNLFVVRDGAWFTPPLSCGLLDGCLRRELLENGPQRVTEKVLTSADLEGAEVWFGNSLRGLVRGLCAALPPSPGSDNDHVRPDGASDAA
jgi:para-aminobenzoate synthetase/4-amino-4-deoxychorismate lyase